MDWTKYSLSRVQRTLQSAFYLGLLAGTVLLVAALLFGVGPMFVFAFAGALVLGLAPRAPVELLMRWRGFRRLAPGEVPAVQRDLGALARRAELPRIPRLYVSRSPQPQAFTVGSREDSAIAVTAGLLSQLEPSEIRAVLAHEIGHLSNGDLGWLAAARMLRRLLGSLALIVWIAFPLSALGLWHPLSGWLLPLALLLPLAGALLESALSRTREYDADLTAAALSGKPRALATALRKLEQYRRRALRWLPFAATLEPPSALSSHPPTNERVRRLLALVSEEGPRRQRSPVDAMHAARVLRPRVARASLFEPRAMHGAPTRWVVYSLR